MAQSAQETLQFSGPSKGSTTYCTRCGGHLQCIDGTDPDRTDELGGFRETYECESCEGTGNFEYQYDPVKRAYSGVCAGQHRWE